MYLIIKGNYLSKKYKINYNLYNNYSNFPYIKKININNNIDSEINNFLKYYRNNLKILKNIANTKDSKIVFITQVIAKDHWLNKYLLLINSETMDFCNKNSTSCIDLYNIISMNDKDDFYDGIIGTYKGDDWNEIGEGEPEKKFPTVEKILSKERIGYKIKYNINEMMFYSPNEEDRLRRLYRFEEYLNKKLTKALLLCEVGGNVEVYIQD